jgi:hypothetical protein
MIPAIDHEGEVHDAGCSSVAPRARCLCGKARYATEGEARRAVKRMKSNGRNHSYAGILHPYMCPERKGIWHVGHTDE